METDVPTPQCLPAVTVIKVVPELDMVTADELVERVCELCRSGDHVIFDMSETTFMDCSGLRALLRANHHVCPGGGSVRLSGLQPGPAKIIAITQIDQCMPVHAGLAEAVKAGLRKAGGVDVVPDVHGPEPDQPLTASV